jgi:DNA-binding NarL/FixJ family response regulator
MAAKAYRILIADDHAVVRRGVMELLREEFPTAHFAEAASATETLEHCRVQCWDLVLLDITMPGRTGLDILRDLRLCCPEMAVLVQSMHAEDQFASRMLKAGAAGYVTKQTMPQELVRAARKVLSGGRYVSEGFAEKLASTLGELDKPAHESLSDREFQVLQKLAAGRSIKEIASELSLSIKTVSTYRTRLLEKLGFGSNAELARYAMQQGLVAD